MNGEDRGPANGTHFLNLEKPAEFNQALREFLKQ
jgi:pimeloyl-ACP methyl ester carboxylesterase